MACCGPCYATRDKPIIEEDIYVVDADNFTNELDEEEPEPPKCSWIFVGLFLVVGGIVYGTALNKSHAWEPYVVRSMFAFKTSILPKLMLSAAGTSAACITLLRYLSPNTQERLMAALDNGKRSSESRTWLAVLIGGLLLGAGMAICGSAPDLLVLQIGAGVSSAWLVLVGAIVGCGVYGILAPWTDKWVLKNTIGCGRQDAMIWPATHFDQFLRIRPFMLYDALAVILLVVAFAWENQSQWQVELPTRLVHEKVVESYDTNSLLAKVAHVRKCDDGCMAWPPALCGVLIGLVQVGCVMTVNAFIGDSDAYQIIASWGLWPAISVMSERTKEAFIYTQVYAEPKLSKWYQIPFLIVVMAVSFILEQSVGDVAAASGVPEHAAFGGGFLMIFGARMCVGGLAGHTYSGVPSLMLYSYIVLPCIFLGGWAATTFWETAGQYDPVNKFDGKLNAIVKEIF